MGTREAGRRHAVPRPPWWAFPLTGFGALLTVLSIATLGYSAVLLHSVDAALEDKPLLPDQEAPDPGDEITGPLNILLVGADLRVDRHNRALADTIIVLHIDRDLDTATLVSIPRDLRVDIPDCGPDAGGAGCLDKINASYSLVGPKVEDSMANLATTLTDLTGVTFDGAAVVNFEGFLSTVEMFGGIELCLSQDLYTEHGDGFYPAGCNEYDPSDALSIVRERKNWPDGDYGRQRMQQHFLRQLLKRAEQEGYLSDPTKVVALIDAMAGQIVYDLQGRDVVDFAVALRHIDPDTMQTLKLPSTTQNIDGVSYVVIQPGSTDDVLSQSLFAAIRDDTLAAWVAANPGYVNADPARR
ncbi:LytR family transcriptional attenuator [Stackebrandtia albiflava]|uniref:LytR family transcriptional attenuator n=1 Tax=Stackebrandtia albiflava TaxID=406432 RepID=A0A562ULJ1_9ACTN|nr:LCP family protein [Stackebrandtia albiflava]TWJ06479.1 LytR family transcriptional attenuator [Stackebrandtia albiflava]